MISLSGISSIISEKITLLKGSNLKAKGARGAAWLGIGTVTERAVRFLRYVILARLFVLQEQGLQELGLMSLILAATLAFDAFLEVGIKQSIIQNKRGKEPDYLNVAWWFQLVRGVVFYSLGFLLVPWLCRFYFQNNAEILAIHSQQELNTLFRVTFLLPLFTCCMSPGAHVLEKEFKFGKAVLIIQGSGVIGALITIILAFFWQSVWTLVIGYTVEMAFRCLLSYLICPFRPRLSIDKECFTELFGFARGVIGLPILTYLSMQADVLVLSKMVSTDKVGLYSWALALAMIPRGLFSHMIIPLLVPTFSEKQDDQSFLSRNVVRMTAVVSMLCLPLIAFVSTCSDSILIIAYGREFGEAAVPFALLCISTIVFMQVAPLTGVCFAVGKPGINRVYALVRAIFLIISIYPAIRLWGLSGAACTVLLAQTIALAVQLYRIKRVIRLDLSEYFRAWLSGIKLGVTVLILGIAVRYFTEAPHIVNLVVIGVISFLASFINAAKLYSSTKSRKPYHDTIINKSVEKSGLL